jgi:RimJ/RimL family protein N-acetyltransferase
LLRPYRLDDAATVFAAIEETRASLERWVPDIGHRRSVADVRSGLAFLSAAAAKDCSRFVLGVWDRSTDEFLGEIGLYTIDHERHVGEVGYWLRERARGHGFIAEALETLAEHAQHTIGLRCLEAHVASENAASRRVLERLGFTVVGHRAPAPHWDGEVADVLIYSRATRGGL